MLHAGAIVRGVSKGVEEGHQEGSVGDQVGVIEAVGDDSSSDLEAPSDGGDGGGVIGGVGDDSSSDREPPSDGGDGGVIGGVGDDSSSDGNGDGGVLDTVGDSSAGDSDDDGKFMRWQNKILHYVENKYPKLIQNRNDITMDSIRVKLDDIMWTSPYTRDRSETGVKKLVESLEEHGISQSSGPVAIVKPYVPTIMELKRMHFDYDKVDFYQGLSGQHRVAAIHVWKPGTTLNINIVLGRFDPALEIKYVSTLNQVTGVFTPASGIDDIQTAVCLLLVQTTHAPSMSAPSRRGIATGMMDEDGRQQNKKMGYFRRVSRIASSIVHDDDTMKLLHYANRQYRDAIEIPHLDEKAFLKGNSDFRQLVVHQLVQTYVSGNQQLRTSEVKAFYTRCKTLEAQRTLFFHKLNDEVTLLKQACTNDVEIGEWYLFFGF